MDIAKKLKILSQYSDDLILQYGRSALENGTKEIEKLREALRFYSNRKNYDLFVRNHPSMGDYETSHILDDYGEIARKALGE